MYELKIVATKVMGTCTAEPPVKRGDRFSVRDGNISIPEGGFICLWALQSILPLITPKEREICEAEDEDWMWRVHHAQCPDPEGRVIFKLERVGKLGQEPVAAHQSDTPLTGAGELVLGESEAPANIPSLLVKQGQIKSLRVVVEEVRGKCTSGMSPGDYLVLHSGRIYIPAGRHFCLYALQAVLPFLPAKQRLLQEGDWLKEDSHVICPDPAGNVIMRIETL